KATHNLTHNGCLSGRFSAVWRGAVIVPGWLPASTLNEREAPVYVHRRGFFVSSYRSAGKEPLVNVPPAAGIRQLIEHVCFVPTADSVLGGCARWATRGSPAIIPPENGLGSPSSH